MEKKLNLARQLCSFLLAKALTEEIKEVKLDQISYTDSGFLMDADFDQMVTTDELFSTIEKRMLDLVNNTEAHSHLADCEFSYYDGSKSKFSLPSAEFSLAKNFKLANLSGAYFQNDSRNKMLKRIHCDCFLTSEDLKSHIEHMEQLARRDHRSIGRVMDLFHFEDYSPGMAFWHNNGMIIFNSLLRYMQEKIQKFGYDEIRTPIVLDRSLWEKSGHWDKFKENMFITSSEHRDFCLKPMNCPGCLLTYNHYLHSYKELPARMAEFGSVHRNESSGSLHGLMRVRFFTQDDAHIFCREDQFLGELIECIKFVQEVYSDFGFDDILIKISTRPEQSIGTDEIWEKSEQALKEALTHQGLSYELLPGEGAFYGPKIEFSLKDVLGRVWQCGTVQIDFSMPERLAASYITNDNKKAVPVMIHRAILGSFERFIAILLENTEGHLPLWLTPVQVVVMNISDKQSDYAKDITAKLTSLSIRAKSDLRAEKIGYKIRESSIKKIPIMLIVGDKEKENLSVSVRAFGTENTMNFDEFVNFFNEKVIMRK